ncbi:hypothetical protein D5S18_08075 [Nocardia panacis]|uniref:Rv3651-like N-terminal domain-containing protein n=2 Tax=Nocardia panacis TaxID=2340916 RepID=A0A3A4KSE6_9NOCA|nr:hypothetical protein D5S18_08075 [Nocardia panacis]
MPDNRVIRMLAVPVLGISQHVYAVSIWAGGYDDPLPRPQVVGQVEWNATGLMTASPQAQLLLRLSDHVGRQGCTLPEMFSSFDHWNDRANFLALFNHSTPSDHWIGSATKTFTDGTQHRIHIAARGIGTGTNRTIRAIVCDITGSPTTAHSDLCSIAIRHMPVPPGHALAIVDLNTGIVHEWLTAEHSPLAGWRHHQPEFDHDSALRVATTCIELAKGVRRTADTTTRVRFHPNDEWLLLHARWTRISNGERPQALIDVTPATPIPAAVTNCRECEAMANRRTPRR